MPLTRTRAFIGVKAYRWRSCGDYDTCAACRRNNGKRFLYAKPPASGHPGASCATRALAKAARAAALLNLSFQPDRHGPNLGQVSPHTNSLTASRRRTVQIRHHEICDARACSDVGNGRRRGLCGSGHLRERGRPCEAVARRVASGADMPPGTRAMAVGVGSFIAARLVAEKYPQIPSSVSCAWVYLRLAWNPDGARTCLRTIAGGTPRPRNCYAPRRRAA